MTAWLDLGTLLLPVASVEPILKVSSGPKADTIRWMVCERLQTDVKFKASCLAPFHRTRGLKLTSPLRRKHRLQRPAVRLPRCCRSREPPSRTRYLDA